MGDVFVQMFDTALAHWMGMDQMGMCVHARTCGSALALEHNGDLYSCDHYVEEGYLLGNIRGDRTLLQLAASPQQQAFGRAEASPPCPPTARGATCGSPATAAAPRTGS